MLCPNCNHEIPDGSAFCPNCGCQPTVSDEITSTGNSAQTPPYDNSNPSMQVPPYDRNYSYQNQSYTDGEASKNGFSIASLVTSLISLICCCGLAFPFQIAALVFGIIGCKSQKRGMAIAGIIISSVTLLILIIWIIYMMAIGAFTAEYIDEFSNSFREGFEYGSNFYGIQ